MWRCGWLLAFAWACNNGPSYPGDQLVGSFHFQATLVAQNCPYADIPGVVTTPDGGRALDGGFTFDAIVSQDSASGRTWVTLNGVTRDAGYVQQIVSSALTAPRRFIECDGGDTQVAETLTFALLSQSQLAAVGLQCPANALTGGVPAPNDAGILAPGPRSGGYDAFRACGELIDVLTPDAPDNQECVACTLRYTVDGSKR